MTDINKFEKQKERAENINRKIAALEGAKRELEVQMEELGVSPETIEPTIRNLEAEAERLRQSIAKTTSQLEKDVEKAEQILNG